MAIGWLTVLQSVPWTDVVRNAPKVAAAAKKLLSTVGKKSTATADPVAAEARVALSPEAQAVAALESRILALETAAAELQNQMIASSGLIKALAEQNTQLILRIETLRLRLWFVGALAVAVLLAAAGMALILAR